MAARTNGIAAFRRTLTLIPASWIVMMLFLASISRPLKPELANSFDPKDYEYYNLFDILLLVGTFVVIPSVFTGTFFQLAILFRIRDKKSILSTALFILVSAIFAWLFAMLFNDMMD